jgi:hypothetical protein
MGRVLLALVITLFLVGQIMAGTWTSSNFLYKPAIGARGDDEKAKFDRGLDRVDSRLANEKWLNDSIYNGDFGTAVSHISNTKTVLSIPAGNWSITENLTVPATLTLKFVHGGQLAVSSGKTLTINGPLDAGPYQVFSLTGTGKVIFGPGTAAEGYCEWFGGKADFDSATGAGTNNAPAINAVYASGLKTVRLLNGDYRIDSTIFMPAVGRLLGTSNLGTRIYPVTSGGTWTANYAVMVNTTTGSTWTTAYPPAGALIQDMQIRGLYGGAYCDVKAICHAGPIDINRVHIVQMKAGVYKTPDYGDRTVYRNLSILYGSDPASYDIDLAQLGDAMYLESVAVGGGITAGVRFNGIGGGRIGSCIFNCNVTIASCYGGTTFQNIHTESGVWTITNSDIAIRDSWLKKSSTGPTVSIVSNNDHRYVCLLDNVAFLVWSDDWVNFTTDRADINYYLCNVDIRGCHRQPYTLGAISESQIYGVSVSYNGTLISAFNNFSADLSNNAHLSNGTHYVENFRLTKYFPELTTGTWSPITAGTTTGTWEITSGIPYYYLVQVLIDPVRKIGKTSSTEVTATPADAVHKLYLLYSNTTGVQGGSLRIYRGTSTGIYSHYVDMPMSNARLLSDNGLSVAGYVWKARTAGPVDGVVFSNDGDITPTSATIKGVIAAPTKGVWTVGDRAVRTPAAGSPKAWVCTVAGGATSTTRVDTTAYSAGTWAIWTTGTTVWECSVAGTSNGSPPDITGKVVGDTVVDGSVTWTCRSLTTATWVSEGNL